MQHQQGPVGGKQQGKGVENEEGASEGDAMTAQYAPPRGSARVSLQGRDSGAGRGKGAGPGGKHQGAGQQTVGLDLRDPYDHLDSAPWLAVQGGWGGSL